MILEINNVQYTGFQMSKVVSSMDTLSDSFVIQANNIWSNGTAKAGDPCRIISNDVPLLDGYIDTIQPDITGNIVITGRDKSLDLIDCTFNGSGEFAGLTMKEIITRLAEPFGIEVAGEDGSTISLFRYGLNERCAEIIRTLVGRYGYICNSDGFGNINIENVGTDRAGFVLQEGNNTLTGSAIVNASARHSTYKVLGQNPSDNAVVWESDGLSERFRPLTVIDSGNIQTEQARSASEWLGGINDGSAVSMSITVADIQDVRPNTLIEVESVSLGVSDDMLIRSVTRTTDSDGSRTKLDLVNPYTFGGNNVENTYL